MQETRALVDDSLDLNHVRYVDVDGVRTRYYEAGSGEPLVLMHGGEYGSLYSLDGWGLNLRSLAQRFHVYALDRLGNGYTDNPKPEDGYTLEALFKHTLGFFTALGIRQAHVVGHSRGGFLGTWLALEHPEALKSLVIVDSRTMAPEDQRFPNDVFYEQLGHRPRLLQGAPTIELVRVEPEAQAYRKEWITDDFIRRMFEIACLPRNLEAQQRLRAIRDESWLPSIYAKRREMLRAIDERGLPMPTLLIWGYNDRSAALPVGIQLFERLAAKTPRVELHVLNQAGHYCFRDQPAAFEAALVSFCLRDEQA